MARRCELTGTGVMSGNNVSHSNRKTRTRFMPNLQNVSLLSETLGKYFHVRVTAHTLRSVEHNGGLDPFLLKRSEDKLTEQAMQIKRMVQKALKNKAA